MVASLRKSDSIAEQALGAFLDEHFYETLHKRDAGFEYERVHDRKRQLKGMDVIVNYHRQLPFRHRYHTEPQCEAFLKERPHHSAWLPLSFPQHE